MYDLTHAQDICSSGPLTSLCCFSHFTVSLSHHTKLLFLIYTISPLKTHWSEGSNIFFENNYVCCYLAFVFQGVQL